MRVGQYSNHERTLRFSNYGVSAQAKVWHSISLGGTYAYRTCNSGCSGLTMFSADAAGTIYRQAALQAEDTETEVAFQVTGGFGKASKADISAASITGFLPMTVSLPQAHYNRLTFSFVPGVAYGRTTDKTTQLFGTPGTHGAVRFILGAAAGYVFPIGLGVHVTVHRITIVESTTQTGFGASWRF